MSYTIECPHGPHGRAVERRRCLQWLAREQARLDAWIDVDRQATRSKVLALADLYEVNGQARTPRLSWRELAEQLRRVAR